MRMLSRGKMTAIGGGWMEGYYVWAEAKKINRDTYVEESPHQKAYYEA